MALVHTQIIGHTLKKGDLPDKDLYALDILCKEPRILQYLVTKLKAFMDDPTIDVAISRILEEKLAPSTSTAVGKKELTPGTGITGNWIEAYGASLGA